MNERIRSPFLPVAERIAFLFPDMERTLIQARMDIAPVHHLAESVAAGVGTAVFFGAVMAMTGAGYGVGTLLQLAAVTAPVAGILGFLLYAKHPDLKARRRVSRLERDLPYALRHLLIEVQSGMTLYEAMVSISEGYGEASTEFQHIVKDINAGVAEMEALEQAVIRNPSLQFRRSLWQMINTLKAGSDLGTTLESLVDAIMDQQMMAVQRYGQELNPYILVYLIGAIIAPSLGVSFLIIFSTFTGGSVSRQLFYFILGGIAVFQLGFLQVIRVKRPKVKT
ncbi:MAG: type II secretion system F family protein [Candidatus Nanohaloarchaea archaeon]|nr:type II secretion system F family protein [Candidatus Nanohaloarchaea archaeon]